MAFDLTIHKLGTNRYDEDITSCVLEEVGALAQDDFEDGYSDRARAAIDVLADQAAKKNPVKIAAWKTQLKGTSPFQKVSNEETLKKAIQRIRTFLVDNGFTYFDKEKQLLTYLGDKEGDMENE